MANRAMFKVRDNLILNFLQWHGKVQDFVLSVWNNECQLFDNDYSFVVGKRGNRIGIGRKPKLLLVANQRLVLSVGVYLRKTKVG